MFLTLMQPEIAEPRVTLFNAMQPRIQIAMCLRGTGTLDLSLSPRRALALSGRLNRLSNALAYEARRAEGPDAMTDYVARACRYIHLTGGNPTIAQFDEDFEPIGFRLRRDLCAQGLATELMDGTLELTGEGVARIPNPEAKP